MTEFDHSAFERSVAAERRRKRRDSVLVVLLGAAIASPAGYVFAGQAGYTGRERQIAAIVGGLGIIVAGLIILRTVQWVFGRLALSVMQPGGAARGPVAHSKAEALAMAGRLDEATAEFEAARAAGGESIASLRAEAELHSTASGDPRRAEELYLRIRKSPQASVNDELYASHRLIDLYLGALDDPGRVKVELRRMADRFPDTIDGQAALAELKRRREAGEQ